MTAPRQRDCADCGKPLDYAGGRWMNLAREGAREKIVCTQCWRKRRQPKPSPPAAARIASSTSPAPPSSPPTTENRQPITGIQAVVTAVRALVARAVRDEVSREVSKTLARWRNE